MRYKEEMPPSKKLSKPRSKKTNSRKMAEEEEVYEKKKSIKSGSKKKPAGIAQAMNKAKEGYSKMPRLQRG